MSKPYYVRIKELADLKNKYRVWKAHMVGELSTNYKSGEMNITIWMVPLINPRQFKDGKNHHLLVENKHYNFKEGKQVEIGVGNMPVIPTGSIFIDGFACELPTYITKVFDFTVTESNQKIISTGSYWKKTNGKTTYYIPREQFQLLDKSKQNQTERRYSAKPFGSKGLVLDFLPEERPKISKNTYPLNLDNWKNKIGNKVEKDISNEYVEVYGLIFFSAELIRFLFSFSSQSCQEVLSDGLAGVPNRLFNPRKTILPDKYGRGGEIRLSQYVTNDDWQILVRPAFDSYALSEFRRPYMSGLINKSTEGSFLPEAKFPFRNQKTKMTVHGTYLQSGDHVYFLVYWIEHCTASFPYTDVKYSRDNPGHQKRKDNSNMDENRENFTPLDNKYDYETQHEKQRQYISTSSPDGIDLQNDAPPGKIMDKIKILLDEKPRFEYILKHPAVKVLTESENEKTNSKNDTGIFIGIDTELESGSTAPTIGSRPIAHTSLVPNSDKKQGSTNYSDWKIHEIARSEIEGDIENSSVSDEESLDAINKSTVESQKKADEKNIPGKGDKKKPISFDIFKDLLSLLENNEEILKKYFVNEEIKQIYSQKLLASMINISSSEHTVSTDNAMRLSSNLAVVERDKRSDKNNLSSKIFVAEITDLEKEKFAYLFDIEPKKSKGGATLRGYKMFLCFEDKSKELNGRFLYEQILLACGRNAGNWDKAFVENKVKNENDDSNSLIFENESSKQTVLRGFLYKHDLDSTDKYAARIIKTLYDSGWILTSRKK